MAVIWPEGSLKSRRSLVDGLLLRCPIGIQETQKANSPALQVLERDEILLNSLSEENRKSFEGIAVRQNKRVWERFANEILPGLKISDYAFLEKRLGQHVPFAENIDQIKKPYPQPTLIILGRQDSAVGYRDQWQLIENYPRASFVILDKAGHNLQIEQEHLFNELVKEWLNRISEETG